MRMRRVSAHICLAVLAGLLGGCDRHQAPTAPAPPVASRPAIVEIAILGLPAPLLFDVPPSLKAGRTYELAAKATLADGSTATLPATDKGWVSNDPTVASFERNTLRAHREGAVRLTFESPDLSTVRDVTVRSAAATVREERSELWSCDEPRPCPHAYPFCRWPYWLFPVPEDGTFELLDVENPLWGGPMEWVTQLSPQGEEIKTWPLVEESDGRSRVRLPGGFMYAFWMDANDSAYNCGRVSAVWTRPN